MQRKSLTGLIEQARSGAIGLAASVACALIEASPAIAIAVTKRMLRRNFERMREELGRQGADTARVVELCRDPYCGECRKEMMH